MRINGCRIWRMKCQRDASSGFYKKGGFTYEESVTLDVLWLSMSLKIVNSRCCCCLCSDRGQAFTFAHVWVHGWRGRTSLRMFLSNSNSNDIPRTKSARFVDPFCSSRWRLAAFCSTRSKNVGIKVYTHSFLLDPTIKDSISSIFWNFKCTSLVTTFVIIMWGSLDINSTPIIYKIDTSFPSKIEF